MTFRTEKPLMYKEIGRYMTHDGTVHTTEEAAASHAEDLIGRQIEHITKNFFTASQGAVENRRTLGQILTHRTAARNALYELAKLLGEVQ